MVSFAAELNRCNRHEMVGQPKIFAIEPFTENKTKQLAKLWSGNTRNRALSNNRNKRGTTFFSPFKFWMIFFFATVLIRKHESKVRKTSSGQSHIRSMCLLIMYIRLKIVCIAATLHNEFCLTAVSIRRNSFRINYTHWEQKNTKFFISKKKAMTHLSPQHFKLLISLWLKKSTQILLLSSSISWFSFRNLLYVAHIRGLHFQKSSFWFYLCNLIYKNK